MAGMTRRLFSGVMRAALVAAVGLLAVHVRAQPQDAARAQTVPTPRTADGHPDLSGMWNMIPVCPPQCPANVGGGAVADAAGNVTVNFQARESASVGGNAVNFERDQGFQRRMGTNLPMYKPEYWEKIQHNDENGDISEDPSLGCMPEGVPRMGPPNRIFQTPTHLIFLYRSQNTFRAIPIDGRPLPPKDEWVGAWMGLSVGHWEGDTMAVESVGFNDESWLDFPGYFHSFQMHVTERFTRDGNTMRYQVTVEDPVVLMKPWVINARTLRLNPDPKAELEEDLPCLELDRSHLVTKERG